jgi:hypothetical protein
MKHCKNAHQYSFFEVVVKVLPKEFVVTSGANFKGTGNAYFRVLPYMRHSKNLGVA